MTSEKILTTLLVILAVGGLAWSVFSFFTISQRSALAVENTPGNFAAFKAAELSDKCQTPPDYTDQEWREHMSHHPDQYQECLTVTE